MPKHKKKITLALQGGGSHGAFTWGVLEKLFEEDVFEILAICGTSAGAVNGCVATYGYCKNGPQGAIDLLNTFWKKVSMDALFSPIQPTVFDKMVSEGNMDYSPGYNFFTLMSNFLSPYQWNPLNLNPLSNILHELIDFKQLLHSKIKLFICATNVKTGQAKVFGLDHINIHSLLASACLPTLFKAVKVGEDYYWDGGYMGNPPLDPLIKGTHTRDIILVQINPLRVNAVPKTAEEISHRINEISFNSSLIAELKLIGFKNKLLNLGYDMNGKLRKIHFHIISADAALEKYDVSSKSNTSWDFLNLLKQKGKLFATKWLNDNYDSVGNETSAYLSTQFQHEYLGQ